MTSNHKEYSNDITLDRGGSRTATSKMEQVVKPLTIILKRFILDAAAALDRLWKIRNVQYKFTEVLRIFAEKVTKELEVIKLAFS